MRRGLVFGKFMPLHRGHQLLIDTALSEVDDLTIVVYDSLSDPRMPIDKRLGWLRQLYPQAEAIVAVPDPLRGRPAAERDDPVHAELYARDLDFLGEFDRVFTSEPSYDEFVDWLGPRPRGVTTRHVIVDAARELVPISGTQIRENLYEHRGWMPPSVYASMIQRVVMVGTESTGKSTLARRLAEEFDTRWTHEYGRELWTKQGGGSFADHWRMAQVQRRREDAAARQARDYLFCDTNAWTTLQWSLMTYGAADARLEDLAERTMGDYLWVLCDNDIPWVQDEDGMRELAGNRAAAFQRQQKLDLHRRGMSPIVARGDLEERVDRVANFLGAVRATA